MSTNTDRQRANALRDLSLHGFPTTIVRNTLSPFNPADGTVATGSTTNYTGYGYPSQYKSYQIDGTLIQQKDTRFVFYSNTRPLVNDIFTFNSKSFTAQDVQAITDETIDIIYIVQLRQ